MRRLTVSLIALSMLPWVIPPASGAVTAGTTTALPAPEQRIRDNSSAIPLFGFSMTSDAGDALDNITITFGGSTLTAGNNVTLYRLYADASNSGVGLYRDDGATDDVLDAADSPVTVDNAFWSTNNVRMVMTSHNEPLPTTTTGSYSWFIVMRTAANGASLVEGGSVAAQLGAGAIVATDGAGYSTQPASTVTTNTMFVRHTRAINLVTGSTNYIGQENVAVHERAPLGLRIIDGRDDAAAGIDDRLAALDLRITQNSGAVNSFDFAPIITDGATSGLAVYRDDGDNDDQFDANDTPITLGSISPAIFPVGGQNFHLTFNPPEAIAHDGTGSVDFLFVVRTGLIVTGDALRLNMILGTAHTAGVLPSDGDRITNTWFNTTSGIVYGDNSPPLIDEFYWSQLWSAYVTASGDRLWFNHQMPVPIMATANAHVYEYSGGLPQSGIERVEWSTESGVATGPNPTTNSYGPGSNYLTAQSFFEFNASSTDGSSPVDITVYDHVGNMVTNTAAGFTLSYEHNEADLVIDPTPGWTSTSGYGLHIDANGTLWFGDTIYGSSWAYLAVTATSTYGGGLESIWTSSASPFGSVPSDRVSYAPGTIQTTFQTQFEVLPNATQADGQVTVTARDQSGTTATRDFLVREDSTGPAVTILSPSASGAVVSDITRFSARVTDAGVGVDQVWIEQLPDGWDYSMFRISDDEFFVDFETTHLSDGPNRFTVFATDRVGNQASASVELVVDNTDIDAVGPVVALVGPAPGSFLTGATTVQVSAQDASGVASAWMRVGQGVWMPLTFNSATGYFEGTWDTLASADGSHDLTVMARDAWLNEASTEAVAFTVDNEGPMVSVTGPAPSQTLAGMYSVRVFASDSNGVSSVTVTLGGRTVDVAYNPSTGYYEYTFDTRTMVDGQYTLTATVEDDSGKSTTSSSVGFTVKNTPDSDLWRSLRESANFLFLLFVILAFVVVLMLAKRGTLGAWMRGGGGATADPRAGPSPLGTADKSKNDDKDPPKSV